MKIGELLVSEGKISRQQLAQALQAQKLLGSRLGTTLLEQGMISEEELLDALGRHRSTRTVSVDDLTGVPPEVVRMIPARLAERYGVVPFHLKGRTLSVASWDPLDLLKEDEIGFLTSCMVRTGIALELRVHQALERYYRIESPTRFQALARRLAARPAQAAPARAQATPAQAQATPAQAQAAPARARQARPAQTPRARPPRPESPARGRVSPPPPPAPPRFIELDEEDAALLGASTTGSSLAVPEPDQPVLLKPAPLPWLAREAARGGEAPSGIGDAGLPAAAVVESAVIEPAVVEPAVVQESLPASTRETPVAGPATAQEVTPGEVAMPEPHAKHVGEHDDEQSAGGYDLEEQLSRAAARLGDVEIRDDIGDVLLAFCRPHFRRRVVLVARKGHIVGWRGEGEGIDRDRTRTIEIPDHDPSVFLGISGASGFWLGALPTLDANRTLVDGLGGAFPKECVVLPVILRSRVVCYLYGDNLESGVAGAPIAELRRLVAKAGLAFEIYILKNKLRML